MALEVRPILWPFTRRPACTFNSVTSIEIRYASSMSASGWVSESGGIGTPSRSAPTSASAAARRFSSLSTASTLRSERWRRSGTIVAHDLAPSQAEHGSEAVVDRIDGRSGQLSDVLDELRAID